MQNHGTGWCLSIASVLLPSTAGAVCTWQGQQKPDDNAATVYALALAELDRNVQAGRVKIPDPQQPQVQLGGRLVVLHVTGELDPVAGQAIDERWQPALDNSVLARALFAQAASRGTCRFEPGQNEGREERLQMLIQLVEAHGRQQLEKQPEQACADAFALLGHSRHVTENGAANCIARGLRIEQKALDLLRCTLETEPRRPPAELVRRCSAELATHLERRLTATMLADSLDSEISELLVIHAPRLRDMHQQLEGGYMPEKMRARIEQLVEPIVAPTTTGKPPTRATWARLLQQHKGELVQPPTPGATIPERAARGMAVLVLHGAERLLAADQASMQKLAQCQDMLRDLSGSK